MATPACCDPGVIGTNHGNGKVVEIAGAKAYQVGNSDKAVIVATDVFGYTFPNIVEVADTYAKAGLTVIIPDLFNGDWIDADAMTKVQNDAEARGKLFGPWIQKHGGDHFPYALFDNVIKEVASSGKYKSIQLNGYCYGVKLVFHSLAEGNINPLVKSAVVAHPSFAAVSDAEKLAVPILFNCAETDGAFTPELKKQFEEILAKRKNASKFIVYPGVSHGFAVRTDGSKQQVEQQKKSHDKAIEWFNSHA